MTSIPQICASIRSKDVPGERCPCRPVAGEWCGRHKTTQVRFVPSESGSEGPGPVKKPIRLRTPGEESAARETIGKAWTRWISRRAGPLLHFRQESNNPFDFFSSDPVTDIPVREFVSFMDAGKGYIMDIKSAVSLIEHSTESKEPPLNPFNRAPLPALFLKRIGLHKSKTAKSWASLEPLTEAQKLSLATTDTFSMIEELGYYTDPSWFIDLGRIGLQRFYMELADIWFHRATLTPADRARVVPSGNPFAVPVSTALIMNQKALRPLVLNTCRQLVSAAVSRADKQLGILYVLGALTIVSEGATAAYPWLLEPGVTRVVNGAILVLHTSVLGY